MEVEIFKENFKLKDGKLFWKVNRGRAKSGARAGTINNQGYWFICISGMKFLEHRVVWAIVNGYLPENQIDHIDRDKLNNKIDNLRETSGMCNLRNTGNPKNNTSGVKGVCFSVKANKWISQIKVDSVVGYLGSHVSFQEAVLHRYAAEQCLDWSGCDSSSPAYKRMCLILGRCNE